MKNMNLIKTPMVALILIFGVGASLGAESDEKGKLTGVPLTKSNSEARLPTSPSPIRDLMTTMPLTQSQNLLAPAPPEEKGTLERIKALEEANKALKSSLEFSETGRLKDVEQLKIDLKRGLEAADMKHANEMKEFREQMGSIIHQRPYVFREQITTNKLLWGMLLYTLWFGTERAYHTYQQGGSFHLALAEGVYGAFGGLYAIYGIGLIFQHLGTFSATIPAPGVKNQTQPK